MISRNKTQSCCGSEAYIYLLKAPVLKEHLGLFEDSGFQPLKHFLSAGILQATKQGLVITVSFGQTKLNARCSGNNCQSLWESLTTVINAIESSNNEKD